MKTNLDLHVFFTPAEIINISRRGQAGNVYIVVDVIRATTTLSVMFDRGASRVFAAESVEQAREGARLFPGRLLCGERNALPLPGFDYGNSPSEFSRLDLTGRELILATTNGTRAFYACPEEATRLAGSFYNAEAVTARALAVAQERGGNIAIVCAGELGWGFARQTFEFVGQRAGCCFDLRKTRAARWSSALACCARGNTGWFV